MIAVVFRRKFQVRVRMRGSPINARPCNNARQARTGGTQERGEECESEHGDLTPDAI